MPTSGNTKVRMLLLMRSDEDETKIRYVPGQFDLETKQGELLEGVQFGPFIDTVLADTTTLAEAYMFEWAKYLRDEGKTELDDGDRREIFGRLLASFSERPMELVGNMFAATLLLAVEEAVNDPEFDEHYEEWAQVFHDSE